MENLKGSGCSMLLSLDWADGLWNQVGSQLYAKPRYAKGVDFRSVNGLRRKQEYGCSSSKQVTWRYCTLVFHVAMKGNSPTTFHEGGMRSAGKATHPFCFLPQKLRYWSAAEGSSGVIARLYRRASMGCSCAVVQLAPPSADTSTRMMGCPPPLYAYPVTCKQLTACERMSYGSCKACPAVVHMATPHRAASTPVNQHLLPLSSGAGRGLADGALHILQHHH